MLIKIFAGDIMPIHTVVKGETLSSIASVYGVSPELAALQNELSDNSSLVIGQQLLILIPQLTHSVKSGDTLYSIAAMHGLTVNELLCNNPWLSTMQLSVGMSVIIEYKEADRTSQIVTNAYAYTDTSEYRLRRALPYLSFITVFTYGFTQDGTLIQPEDERILALAEEYGTPPVMLLSTLTEAGTFSNQLAAYILNNKGAQEVLLNNVLNTMLEKGYKGLDIDFEYLPIEDRDNYADFVAYFTKELNKYGFITLVALAPKSSATQTGLLYEGHDYARLGAAANLSLAMTYEWGYTYGHIWYMQKEV
jgi:spore germination protein